MTFTVRPAVREKIGLLFGVAGASGSGKTFTALTLAKGIANGTGRIAVIDTEASRALHYAPPPGKTAADVPGTFDFLHIDFQPPFEPEQYIEAIRAAEAAGATVIVIDSMSHEWAGEGGCSDMQAAEAERMATDRNGKLVPWKIETMTAPAWKKPKQRHQRMMARLIQTRTHLIFCLRAQEKIKIAKVPDEKGHERTQIIPMGFQPICEKSFMFELSGSMTLHPETPGSPRYDLPHKLNDALRTIFPERSLIGDKAGKQLREWAETGAERPAADKPADVARGMIECIQDAADEASLKALTGSPAMIKDRAWMAKNRPELAERVTAAINAAQALYETDDIGMGDGEDAGGGTDPVATLVGDLMAHRTIAEIAKFEQSADTRRAVSALPPADLPRWSAALDAHRQLATRAAA